ncbi:NAD-dependent epimerase/dehydratase family protein [Gordonia polyisoprenivorans]|uniref:NAD-dependent epimerase/dehydratase family protein n=1 Tax=Gordonia polyisoprenivorans TaxID=84595 RepID=UPI00054E92DF|nr:NAD-dependent epimerase/dehydratase family protein [Gordonia polyisoprenivorans]
MKALVTGGAGFIGSSLCRKLAQDGVEVVIVDCLTDYYDVKLKLANVSNLPDSISFLEHNLLDMDLEKNLQDVTHIFHLAGQPGVRGSWGTKFHEYTERNILATQRLLEAARSAPRLERFVYSSSSSVYGDAEPLPMTESSLPVPRSPYGVSKLAAEHLVSLYSENFGIPTVSLRYFTVYGPGQRPDMAFTRFLSSALKNDRITIYGDGTQVRDFTYVSDIVDANILAARRPVELGAVFNVAGGTSVSVNEVLEMIGDLSRVALDVEYIAGVAGDVRATAGDTSKIKQQLGWFPSVGLRDGLASQFDWIKFSTLS